MGLKIEKNMKRFSVITGNNTHNTYPDNVTKTVMRADMIRRSNMAKRVIGGHK
jgi:hypothetical protein